MKIALLTLSALSVFPLAARAQSLSPDSTAHDTAAAVSVLLTSRVGISSEQLKNRQPPATRSATDTSSSHALARLGNVLQGAGLGILGGGAFGAVVGLVVDANARGETMIPATFILGLYGAILGGVAGLIWGATWPTQYFVGQSASRT